MSFKIEFDLDDILSKASNEIPISEITAPFEEKLKLIEETETPDNFSLKETTTGEESVSIFYKQGKENMYISIFGPREMRFRDKASGEYAKIEMFIKFSLELSASEQELITEQLKDFAKKIILRTSYPRCQITINMNIFNSSVNFDKYSLIPKMCNGLMMALCISGINLKTLCMAKGYLKPENERCMIFMEVNDDQNKIFDIETDEAFDMDFYVNIVEKTKKSFDVMNKKLKNIIYKKLTQ